MQQRDAISAPQTETVLRSAATPRPTDTSRANIYSAKQNRRFCRITLSHYTTFFHKLQHRITLYHSATANVDAFAGNELPEYQTDR